MAREIRAFNVTIPAGTPKTAYQTTALEFPPRIVTGVSIRVPPGPNGLMGFRLSAAGVPVIPQQADAWLVVNDEALDWPLTGYHDSGAWQMQGYNTGTMDHTVYIRFLLELVTGPTTSQVAIIPSDQLGSFTAADLEAITAAGTGS